MPLARAQQFGWAQQAADMIGAERWTRHVAHRNLPILMAFVIRAFYVMRAKAAMGVFAIV